MNTRFPQTLRSFFLIIGMLLLAACGTLEVGMQGEPLTGTAVSSPPAAPTATGQPALSPTPTREVTLEATEEPTPAIDEPAATEPAIDEPVDPSDPSPLWSVYRDPATGFGYAFPCHWISRGTSLVSYDEMYFLNRSVRGHWADGSPPEGAVKLEIAVFDYAASGIQPGTALEEAVSLAIDNTIVASERVTLGAHEALRVQLEGMVFPDDETNEIYFFELSPEAMLLLSVSPRKALASPDVQNIVESLALSAGDPVVVPAVDPQGSLEDRAVFADEAAGYCFQYPSEYTLETFPPSGVPYAGDIATLKLERPFYTLGLTSSALPVGEQSVLEELVTQFLQGLPDDAGSQVVRNPAEMVGGVDFQIGGEPAEFLEGVPGAEGSRDIFAKHGDRLYRLSFVPSPRINPQAAPDLEPLFLVVTTSFSFLP